MPKPYVPDFGDPEYTRLYDLGELPGQSDPDKPVAYLDPRLDHGPDHDTSDPTKLSKVQRDHEAKVAAEAAKAAAAARTSS